VRLGCSGSVGWKFCICWMKNKYRGHDWARFLSPASPYVANAYVVSIESNR
jgi:hypothetical protein